VTVWFSYNTNKHQQTTKHSMQNHRLAPLTNFVNIWNHETRTYLQRLSNGLGSLGTDFVVSKIDVCDCVVLLQHQQTPTNNKAQHAKSAPQHLEHLANSTFGTWPHDQHSKKK